MVSGAICSGSPWKFRERVKDRQKSDREEQVTSRKPRKLTGTTGCVLLDS